MLRSQTRWSQYYSRPGAGAEIICLINIYCRGGKDEEKPPLRHISYGTTFINYSFKWQYMADAGAGAKTEIRDKGGAGAENKLFRLNNTAQKFLFLLYFSKRQR